jgi:SH3 domain protein
MMARIAALACLLCATLAHAETRYISDKLSVELRRGPGNEYKITRNLDAGLSVEVVEQTPEGYSRVHVGDTEGWVLTQFLTTGGARATVLPWPNGRRAMEGARGRSRAASRGADCTARRRQDRARPHARQPRTCEPGELANIKTAAANVVEIQQQNESLRQKTVDRDRRVEELTVANGALSSRSRQNWFIVGAAVLFGGIVIGLIAPSLRRKRRSDW